VTEPYEDALTAPWWEAARRGVLLLQRCGSCGRHQHYPRPFCLGCGSDDVGWVEAGGGGTVYSLTTVRLAVLARLEPPYDVALVDLDEGVRLLGRVVGARVGIGDRVVVGWETAEDRPVLVFGKAPEEAP
jgi:uncharacterized OB-fold protein